MPRNSHVRLAFAGAIIAAFALTAPVAIAAEAPQPAPNLVFEDEHPLKLRLNHLTEVEVRICNLGDAAANAEARLVGFGFERAGEGLSTEAVLEVDPRTLTIGARECVSLTLAAAIQAATPDAGDYTVLSSSAALQALARSRSYAATSP